MAIMCLLGMATNTAGAASTQQPTGNADVDHQVALNKAFALLNAPDPALRIVAFDQIPAGDRQQAISQALVSMDPTLRGTALASFFHTNKSILIKIDRYNIARHYFIDKIGGAFNIYTGNFDANRFTFSTVTDFNRTRNEGQTVVNLAQLGVVSGDRISFAADFANAGISKCIVNLLLDQAMLANHSGFANGTMSCNNNEYYTVQWVFDTPNAGSKNLIAAGIDTTGQVINTAVLVPFALMGLGIEALKPNNAPPKVSAAERQGEITRDLDLLNSPDPAVRLATLEVGVANGDRILRNLLLTSAFASSDPILRGAALAGAVGTAENIPITIVGHGSNNHYLSEKIDEKAYVFIRNFDQKSLTFDTITEYNTLTYSNQYKKNVSVPQSGMVSGDRLSFVADFNDAGSPKCNVNLALDRVGSTAHGTMACANGEKYAIESDLLK